MASVTGSPRRRRLTVVALAMVVAGCQTLESVSRDDAFPPQRTLLASLSEGDRAAHGAAVVTALGTPAENVPIAWRGTTSGVEGTVTVLEGLRHASGLVCARVRDGVTARGSNETVLDLACWSGREWVWARDGGASEPVVPPNRPRRT